MHVHPELSHFFPLTQLQRRSTVMPETLFFESPQDTFQLRDSKMTDIPVSFALKLGEAMLYDVIFSYVYASTF